jgi:ATP-dependent protease ClpP protease subunit
VPIRILDINMDSMPLDYFSYLLEQGEREILISSRGGDPVHANSLRMEMLKYKDITATIQGLCYSAGTLILAGASVRKAYKGSLGLYHSAKIGGYGDSKSKEDEKRMLDLTMTAVKEIYLNSSKLTLEQIEELLSRDSFLSADEMYEMGFLTEKPMELKPNSEEFEELTLSMSYKETKTGGPTMAEENKELTEMKAKLELAEKELTEMKAKLEADEKKTTEEEKESLEMKMKLEVDQKVKAELLRIDSIKALAVSDSQASIVAAMCADQSITVEKAALTLLNNAKESNLFAEKKADNTGVSLTTLSMQAPAPTLEQSEKVDHKKHYFSLMSSGKAVEAAGYFKEHSKEIGA